jgi:hypothetical protein
MKEAAESRFFVMAIAGKERTAVRRYRAESPPLSPRKQGESKFSTHQV